jgi:hypothetical protein
VPTPGRIYYQGVLNIGTGINAKNPRRAPLLLIAGEEGRTTVPSMVQATYKTQRHAPSVTAFKSFPGRSLFLMAEGGWEEIADYAIRWASTHAREVELRPDHRRTIRRRFTKLPRSSPAGILFPHSESGARKAICLAFESSSKQQWRRDPRPILSWQRDLVSLAHEAADMLVRTGHARRVQSGNVWYRAAA